MGKYDNKSYINGIRIYVLYYYFILFVKQSKWEVTKYFFFFKCLGIAQMYIFLKYLCSILSTVEKNYYLNTFFSKAPIYLCT